MNEVLQSYLALARVPAPTSESERESTIDQLFEASKKFLSTRHELYSKQMEVVIDHFIRSSKARRDPRFIDAGSELLVHLMDNMMLYALFTAVHAVVQRTPELDSFRNQMNAYAQIMQKFKELVDDKESGEKVESWFKLMWDRQVKRGVVQ